MEGTKAEVMSFKLDTDRDVGCVHVTVELTRHSQETSYAGVEPDVCDLPEDFRKALGNWLTWNE